VYKTKKLGKKDFLNYKGWSNEKLASRIKIWRSGDCATWSQLEQIIEIVKRGQKS